MQVSHVSSNDLALVEEDHLIALYKRRDITLARGEGVYLWDVEGRRYLDMMSNYGVNILGHSHPSVTAAIIQQASTLSSCHQSFSNDTRAHFVAALAAILPEGLRHISFGNSGAEAVEAALKYARAASGRTGFLATKRSYHGRTIGALSVTGEQKHRAPFEPLLAGVELVPFGDLAAARDAMSGVAAMIVEPIQGESGVRLPPPDYLRGLRRLCDETGTLLIFDEVQTAFRTGCLWASEHYDALPDIMTLSKPLANGLPLGVTVVSDRIAAGIPAGSHGSTFGGNPLSCAAGLATLSIVSATGFQEQVRRTGGALVERLRTIRHPSIREVRGLGLMVAVELKRNVSPILQRMQHAGVLAISAGSTNVRFLPPLIIAPEEIETACDVFEASLGASGMESTS